MLSPNYLSFNLIINKLSTIRKNVAYIYELIVIIFRMETSF